MTSKAKVKKAKDLIEEVLLEGDASDYNMSDIELEDVVSQLEQILEDAE